MRVVVVGRGETYLKFDMHTHHSRCGHAVGSIKDYVEEAINLGLQIIGVSDHSPFWGEDQDFFDPGSILRW